MLGAASPPAAVRSGMRTSRYSAPAACESSSTRVTAAGLKELAALRTVVSFRQGDNEEGHAPEEARHFGSRFHSRKQPSKAKMGTRPNSSRWKRWKSSRAICGGRRMQPPEAR